MNNNIHLLKTVKIILILVLFFQIIFINNLYSQTNQKEKSKTETITSQTNNESENPENSDNSLVATKLDIPSTESYFTRQINRFLSQELNTQIIISIIIYLILSIIVLFFVILINRKRLLRREKKSEIIRSSYQDQLAQYVFDEDSDSVMFFPIKNNFKRQIFIDELLKFHADLSGESAEKLREMYYNLNLNEDSLKKAMHKKWHHKAKGFRELAQMDVPAKDIIKKHINSKNPILRVEAQTALIKLDKENPLGFLDNLNTTLSRWEMINIYNALVSNNINIESFEKWLDKKNTSVVIFAIIMIKLFKHLDSAPKVSSFLYHNDPDVRHAAIETIDKLDLPEYKNELKELYYIESYLEENHLFTKSKELKISSENDILDEIYYKRNKLALIDAVMKSAESEDTFFFGDILRNGENDFLSKLKAAKAIASTSSINTIKLNNEEKTEVQEIINCVFKKEN